MSSRLVRVVALGTALREALGSGLVNLIVTLVPATDAPHEGSGSAPMRSGPVAAHEWEPLSGSPPLGPWRVMPSPRRPPE